MTDLAALLGAAAAGSPPPADGEVMVIDPPDDRSVGVFAFTAHHVVSADVDVGWVRSVLPPGDLSAPLNPPFLAALSARGQGLGRTLFSAGLGLIPPGERLWAQVALGNAM